MTMNKIRNQVSEAYSKAVTRDSGCCGARATIKSAVAGFNQYGDDELETLPEDAVTNSFGCGNPLAFSGVKPGDTVLDLGCGAGIDLLIASRRVGPEGHVIGIDMTDAMLDRARVNIEKAGAVNTEVRKGYIEELPVADNSVDWVISNCVINLSGDKQKVFGEISRVLRPGGQLLISDIVAQNLPDWIRNNPATYNACLAGAISEAGYLQGLEEAGLTDLRVEDRLIYEVATLEGLIKSGEIPGAPELLQSIPEAEREARLSELLTQLAGQVWSAKFAGRKA